jgi:tripartite-type tricarboxylate transporter receptor subunit TctC
MNPVRRIAEAALIVLAVSVSIVAAHAEPYPSTVIRIVVPTPPGTPPDIISRVVATELSESEGWRMGSRIGQARFKPSAWRRC